MDTPALATTPPPHSHLHQISKQGSLSRNESGMIMSDEWVMHQEWAAACGTCDSSGPLERSYFQNPVATETRHGGDQERQTPPPPQNHKARKQNMTSFILMRPFTPSDAVVFQQMKKKKFHFQILADGLRKKTTTKKKKQIKVKQKKKMKQVHVKIIVSAFTLNITTRHPITQPALKPTFHYINAAKSVKITCQWVAFLTFSLFYCFDLYIYS